MTDKSNFQFIDGLFSYKGADIENIMRQASRWYNVDVVFEKPVQEKF
ncbi:MAG: DUF4974 domain-containing protein [Puia sp.]